jgi:hypothetical protein
MNSNQLLLEKIIKDFNDYQAFEKIAEEKIKEGTAKAKTTIIMNKFSLPHRPKQMR